MGREISKDPDKSYVELGTETGELVTQKQLAYGDSFGKSGAVLRQLYPNGIRIDQYDDMLTIVRILDKLFRIATDPSAFGENPYRDITGYGLLGMHRYNNQESKNVKGNTAVREGSTTGPDCNPQRPEGTTGEVPSEGRRGEDNRGSKGHVYTCGFCNCESRRD